MHDNLHIWVRGHAWSMWSLHWLSPQRSRGITSLKAITSAVVQSLPWPQANPRQGSLMAFPPGNPPALRGFSSFPQSPTFTKFSLIRLASTETNSKPVSQAIFGASKCLAPLILGSSQNPYMTGVESIMAVSSPRTSFPTGGRVRQTALCWSFGAECEDSGKRVS